MIDKIKNLDLEILIPILSAVSLLIFMVIFCICRYKRRERNKRSATDLLDNMKETFHVQEDDESIISDD